MQQLLAPLLSTPGGSLRWLACSALPRGCVQALTASLGLNRRLGTLKLGCNCLDVGAALLLATAIER